VTLPAGLPASRARRRALALALLGALLLAGWGGLVQPLLDAQAARQERAAEAAAQLARFVRARAETPALAREIAALDGELAGPNWLLRAPSASQAAAQLAAGLRSLLEAAGIRAETSQALPPVPLTEPGATGLLRIGVRLEFRAGLEEVHRAMQALEAHRPALVVREALLAGGQRGAEGLAVRLDVFGVARVAPDPA
jgi:hypothetical protein